MVMDIAEQASRVESILGHPGKLFIAGEWVPSTAGTLLETSDPGTGKVLTEVPLGSAEDIDAAVAAARAALRTWRRTAPLERASILWRVADLIEANADELAVLETLDTGKPLTHARSYDMTSAIDEFRFMSG